MRQAATEQTLETGRIVASAAARIFQDCADKHVDLAGGRAQALVEDRPEHSLQMANVDAADRHIAKLRIDVLRKLVSGLRQGPASPISGGEVRVGDLADGLVVLC